MRPGECTLHCHPHDIKTTHPHFVRPQLLGSSMTTMTTAPTAPSRPPTLSMYPTHILRARDTSSATRPGAYLNSNGWANPPLLRYLVTAHPTSIDMGVVLMRSNKWVGEATCAVSAGHMGRCQPVSVAGAVSAFLTCIVPVRNPRYS